jgi:integrase
MRFLEESEVERLTDAIDPRYRAFVLVGAYAGLRWGEAGGLTIDRLDLLRRSLTVARTLVDVRGHVSLGEVKTPASVRKVALPGFLVEELARHIEHYPPGAHQLVFTSPGNGPLRRTNWRRRAWTPAVRESVGEPLRFHDLRHSHAAMLIAQGEHPQVIRDRLGHRSIATTLNVYGHLFDGLDEAAAMRLDERRATVVRLADP